MSTNISYEFEELRSGSLLLSGEASIWYDGNGWEVTSIDGLTATDPYGEEVVLGGVQPSVVDAALHDDARRAAFVREAIADNEDNLRIWGRSA